MHDHYYDPNHIHVYAICIRPGVLKVFLESLTERVRHLMKANEFPDSEKLRVVPSSSGIEPLDDSRDVSEDGCVH